MKRSPKGGGTIRYKPEKKIWEARFSVGHNPGTGWLRKLLNMIPGITSTRLK
mgnify:CR=1 FL=1